MRVVRSTNPKGRLLALLVPAVLALAACGSPSPTATPTDTASSGPPASAGPAASSATSPPEEGQVWSVPDAVRASADADPGLVASLGSATSPMGGPSYAVTAIRQHGDWALVMIEDADPQMAADAGFAVAVRSGGQWTVVQATDNAAFCAALAKAPAGVLTAYERDYFMGCH
jgi:hypothetical protein